VVIQSYFRRASTSPNRIRPSLEYDSLGRIVSKERLALLTNASLKEDKGVSLLSISGVQRSRPGFLTWFATSYQRRASASIALGRRRGAY
jgi:hypothetical protein